MPEAPKLTDRDRKEMQTMRLLIDRNGTYKITGVNKAASGKWNLKGRVVKFSGTEAPDDLTLSKDGTSLSEQFTLHGKTWRLTYVRQ